MKNRIASIIFLALIVFSATCFGQEIRPIPGISLNQGQIAPTDGVLFGNESLIALVNALRETLTLREKVKILEGQAAALADGSAERDNVIAALQEQKTQMRIAIDKLEFINANHRLIENAHKTANGIILDALKEAREDNKALRSELWWTKIFSAIPIIGLIVAAIQAGL